MHNIQYPCVIETNAHPSCQNVMPIVIYLKRVIEYLDTIFAPNRRPILRIHKHSPVYIQNLIEVKCKSKWFMVQMRKKKQLNAPKRHHWDLDGKIELLNMLRNMK